MLGVTLGFPVMVAVLGAGFGATIASVPAVQDAVSAIGIPYLLWLSWKIASADVHHGMVGQAHVSDVQLRGARATAPQPMSFIGASAFQWVNAKAWIMAIGMVAIYAPVGYGVPGGIAIIVAVNLTMAILSTLTWTACGTVLAAWLGNPRRLRLFNWTMAALLVATLVEPALTLLMKYL
jgi:threonine/homoserine/homoserine lactone efflux protein